MDAERRARFKAWFEAAYTAKGKTRADFMSDSAGHGDKPLTKGRVTQLFDDDQPFGEAAARNLAVRFGLPADFFLRDLQAGSTGSAVAEQSPTYAVESWPLGDFISRDEWTKLSTAQRHAVQWKAREALDAVRAAAGMPPVTRTGLDLAQIAEDAKPSAAPAASKRRTAVPGRDA